MARDDAHPVSTIQRDSDNIVAVTTDFVKSSSYILFDDSQLLASYVGVNRGLKSTVACPTCRTPNNGLHRMLAPLL